MVRCPFCGIDNSDQATTCNSCGRLLYSGHVVYEQTYLGEQRYVYSDRLVIGVIAIFALVAIASISYLASSVPDEKKPAIALAIVFALVAVAAVGYGVLRATKREGPVRIGGQVPPSAEEVSSQESDLERP